MDIDQIIQFISKEWLLASIFVGLLVGLLLVTWRERAIGAFRIDPQKVTQLINREQALVIDLRDNTAFMQGHIVGAKNIPQSRLQKEAAEKELIKYKTKPIILTCDAGRVSPANGIWLRKNGFEQVYMLAGGIQAWRAAGLPLTTENK